MPGPRRGLGGGVLLQQHPEGLLRDEDHQPDAVPKIRRLRPDGVQAGDAIRGTGRSQVPRPGEEIAILNLSFE